MKKYRWIQIEGDTQTFDFEEMENETEDDDDDDGGFNHNGDDDNDDDGDVETEDDDHDDGSDDEGNFVDGVTANGDVSNIKHLICETRWYFLKHKTLQVGEEITFTFCTATSERNDCTVLYEARVLWTLYLITFSRISTQLTEIHVGGATLQTWQGTRSLRTLTVRRKVDGW